MDYRDSDFRVVTAGRLTNGQLRKLVSRHTAAVRVPNLLTPHDCATVLAALAGWEMQSYDISRVQPPVSRFGPAINDHRCAGKLDSRYWREAEKARAAWCAVGDELNPITVCCKILAAAWGHEPRPATIGGRPVYMGVIREINDGTPIHFDCVNREFPQGLFDQNITDQLALNVYVSVTEIGGEMTIWPRHWETSDESHRVAYGYASDVVSGITPVAVRPLAGDCIFMNPANYHAVRASSSGRRIAVALFLGITSGGDLVAWS